MQDDTAFRYPLVFVTGVGQTWSSLRAKPGKRWNLFPRDKDIVIDTLSAKDKRKLVSVAAGCVRYLMMGGRPVDRAKLQWAVGKLLRFCRVDENGDLPAEVDVHIYGPRSFAELGKTDFYTGGITDIKENTLLDRLLRDVPCTDFVEEYGAENMFCFNYSPFTDIYRAADSLHETILKIVEGRPVDKVILVPMSMGAAVTLAYLDRHAGDESCLIRSVVSIVGAWDGSEGFADLVIGKVNDKWDEMVYGEMLPASGLPAPLKKLLTKRPERTNALLRRLLDALLDEVLMRSSAFLALIPSGRWEDVGAYVFDEARFRRNSRLGFVKEQAVRYAAAQKDIVTTMHKLNAERGVDFSFVGGSGLRPGEESRDFSFMKLFASADRTDTDGVLQITSAMPFMREDDASFVKAYRVFDRQPHEIGGNAEAMRFIFDLIEGAAAKN